MVLTNPPKKRISSNCVTMEKNKSTNLCDVAQHCIVQTNHSLLRKQQFRRQKEVQVLFFFQNCYFLQLLIFIYATTNKFKIRCSNPYLVHRDSKSKHKAATRYRKLLAEIFYKLGPHGTKTE